MSRRYKPGALREAVDAARWYEVRKPGLGEDFDSELDSLLSIVEGQPDLFPKIRSFRTRRNVRRCNMNRFPYAIIYEVRPDDDVVIIAVAHHKRRPNFWKGRL